MRIVGHSYIEFHGVHSESIQSRDQITIISVWKTSQDKRCYFVDAVEGKWTVTVQLRAGPSKKNMGLKKQCVLETKFVHYYLYVGKACT